MTDWIWEERVKVVKMKYLKQLAQQAMENEETLEEEQNKDNETIEVIDEEIPIEEISISAASLNSVKNGRFRTRRSNIEYEMAKFPERKKVIF